MGRFGWCMLVLVGCGPDEATLEAHEAEVTALRGELATVRATLERVGPEVDGLGGCEGLEGGEQMGCSVKAQQLAGMVHRQTVALAAAKDRLDRMR